MRTSRAVVGLATFIFATAPLLGLAQLSYDIRYLEFRKTFSDADVGFPFLSSTLWIFGPLDWWGFITPLALAVAAAACIRVPLGRSTLAVVLGATVLQGLVLVAASKPYFTLTTVVGYPVSAPYPGVPLLANVSLLGVSLGLAYLSVSRPIAHRGSHVQEPCDEESASSPRS